MTALYSKDPSWGGMVREALLLARLNRTQRNICSFLWHDTYGCNRTMKAISLSEFKAACLCCKEYIARQIKNLMKKRIIKRVFVPGRASIYYLNPDVTDWVEGCIDLEALEHSYEFPAGNGAPVEMTNRSSTPEALKTDGSQTEVDEPEGSSADKDVVTAYPTAGWQTDYIPLSPKKTGRQFGEELTSCTTQELTYYTTQELTKGTTPAHTLSRAGPGIAPLLNTV